MTAVCRQRVRCDKAAFDIVGVSLTSRDEMQQVFEIMNGNTQWLSMFKHYIHCMSYIFFRFPFWHLAKCMKIYLKVDASSVVCRNDTSMTSVGVYVK